MVKKRSIFGIIILIIGVFAVVYLGLEIYVFHTHSSEIGMDFFVIVTIITVLILLYAGFTAESSLSNIFLGTSRKTARYNQWKEDHIGVTKPSQIKNLCPKCNQEIDINIKKCPKCGFRFEKDVL